MYKDAQPKEYGIFDFDLEMFNYEPEHYPHQSIEEFCSLLQNRVETIFTFCGVAKVSSHTVIISPTDKIHDELAKTLEVTTVDNNDLYKSLKIYCTPPATYFSFQ